MGHHGHALSQMQAETMINGHIQQLLIGETAVKGV